MRVGALCVPGAEVLLLEASGGLVPPPQFSRNFPAPSRTFLALDWTLPDRTPPPPPPAECGFWPGHTRFKIDGTFPRDTPLRSDAQVAHDRTREQRPQ